MVAAAKNQLPLGQRLKLFTPLMAFLAIYLSLAALNFGYDVGTFGGVQAMPYFIQKFGSYNSSTKKYALPAYMTSLLNSFPFFGKLIGALACGPISERWGRKSAVGILACISLVGVTLQTSATTPEQFLIGRVINFAMTGFCIVVTPIYQAECAPAELRGLISATLQFQIGFGQLIASLVNFGTQKIVGDSSWRIPIGLQFIVPVFILLLLPIMPESPRWLISKGRHEAATNSLQKLRGKNASQEQIQWEIEALSNHKSNEDKGSWREVFDRENWKRTIIAILAMFFQQITGQAFTSQYSVVFYKQQGFTNAFLLGVVNNIVSLFCTLSTSLVVDRYGRRPILLAGGSLMAAFLFILGGVGVNPHPNQREKNTMVASVVLYGGAYAISWAPISYIILGEVSTVRLKEKTNDLAVSISVLTTFVVSFTVPYLLNAPYANLGAKVGFIYGSLTAVSVIVSYFMIPEMKGRSLEEVDQLFASGVSLRRFGSFETTRAEDIGREDKVAVATEVEVARAGTD
ncbi:hypothetical protein OIDMADRAFT_45246 [Oidiodendron maius Zn]|uniref:Major facilitator superfamily (MFS) profile domain-containing protein n=1 Tax=Oidiodendron maius (strain Zn) TaxID=913774 RepID=A0A0C3GVN0_OIDMZ|nr:hypothetical protein OIDMADRAFT_45246 [Oidiodendron maius Zn]